MSQGELDRQLLATLEEIVAGQKAVKDLLLSLTDPAFPISQGELNHQLPMTNEEIVEGQKALMDLLLSVKDPVAALERRFPPAEPDTPPAAPSDP